MAGNVDAASPSSSAGGGADLAVPAGNQGTSSAFAKVMFTDVFDTALRPFLTQIDVARMAQISTEMYDAAVCPDGKLNACSVEINVRRCDQFVHLQDRGRGWKWNTEQAFFVRELPWGAVNPACVRRIVCDCHDHQPHKEQVFSNDVFWITTQSIASRSSIFCESAVAATMQAVLPYLHREVEELRWMPLPPSSCEFPLVPERLARSLYGLEKLQVLEIPSAVARAGLLTFAALRSKGRRANLGLSDTSTAEPNADAQETETRNPFTFRLRRLLIYGSLSVASLHEDALFHHLLAPPAVSFCAPQAQTLTELGIEWRGASPPTNSREHERAATSEAELQALGALLKVLPGLEALWLYCAGVDLLGHDDVVEALSGSLTGQSGVVASPAMSRAVNVYSPSARPTMPQPVLTRLKRLHLGPLKMGDRGRGPVVSQPLYSFLAHDLPPSLESLELCGLVFAELDREQTAEIWRGLKVESLLLEKVVMTERQLGGFEGFLTCSSSLPFSDSCLAQLLAQLDRAEPYTFPFQYRREFFKAPDGLPSLLRVIR